MNERKTAPEEVMIVGYFLTEARTALAGETSPYDGNALAYGYAYLTSAVNAVPAARASLSRELESRQMWPSNGLHDLDVACIEIQRLIGEEYVAPMRQRAVANLIGRGHQKLAEMMFKLGFNPITNADFKKLRRKLDLPGGGGGR